MTFDPHFLKIEQVLELHERTIAIHGGEPGIRDLGLLDSALAQPMAMYAGEFLHEGIAEMAAAYLFHIAKNHPFIDGNKRAAVLAMLTFLAANGSGLTCSDDEMEDVVLQLAKGELGKSQLTEFVRRVIRQTEG